MKITYFKHLFFFSHNSMQILSAGVIPIQYVCIREQGSYVLLINSYKITLVFSRISWVEWNVLWGKWLHLGQDFLGNLGENIFNLNQ